MNSGSMEYININSNSVSFSYGGDRAMCEGYAEVMQGVMREGLCGGIIQEVMRGIYQSESFVQFGSHFLCPHCRGSDRRGHTETRLGCLPVEEALVLFSFPF